MLDSTGVYLLDVFYIVASTLQLCLNSYHWISGSGSCELMLVPIHLPSYKSTKFWLEQNKLSHFHSYHQCLTDSYHHLIPPCTSHTMAQFFYNLDLLYNLGNCLDLSIPSKF